MDILNGKQAIIKISVTDQVVENIKNRILLGEFKEGDKLPPENELCQQLMVGRSTIREAYRVLQTMGYVQLIHGRGAFVANGENQHQSAAESWFLQNNYQLREIWDARVAIEQMAVKRAVEHMTDEEIDTLGKIQDNFAQAVIQGQVNQMALYDEYFHAYLVEGSHNSLLVSLNSFIANAARSYRLNSFTIASNRCNALKPHQDIVDALRARDVARACTALENHINISIEDINRILTNKNSEKV